MLHTKVNSQHIKDLNVRPGTINLLVENIGTDLLDTGLGSRFFFVFLFFSRYGPKSKGFKRKNKPIGLYQNKILHTRKEPVRGKRQPTDERKYTQTICQIRG